MSRYWSSDHQRSLNSQEWGDINPSNWLFPHGRPDYWESRISRTPHWPDPYDIDHYTAQDYEHRRPRVDFEGNQIRQPHYQGVPRIKPETYTGTEDWEEYRSHFEDCAELSGWDHRSKVLFLTARQRKPGENITALGDELRQLDKTAYRNLDTDAQETLALNKLYKPIPVVMKCRCIDHDCQSVQQAVEIIERYEAILGEAAQERKKNNLRSIDHETELPNTDPNISSFFKKLDARLEKLEGLNLT